MIYTPLKEVLSFSKEDSPQLSSAKLEVNVLKTPIKCQVSPLGLPKGLTSSACGFQTLIHRASAGDERGLFRRAPVGAVALAAVTLQAIRR